jgi:hypothetical protein
MSWRRLGLVYRNSSSHPALASHAALPVAVVLKDDLVRVFYSGRDQSKRSSIGTLVVRVGEVPRIEEKTSGPLLEPGAAGTFDDSGLGVGSCVSDASGDRIYYMGWNVGGSVPWRNAIGLAIGNFQTGRCERFSAGPIMDRDPVDHLSLSYPWVLKNELPEWRMWYGTHLAWGAGKTDMYHAIRVARSADGIAWAREPSIAIQPDGEEIAVVRPTGQVGVQGGEMWFARRGLGPYRLGYATSPDLVTWTRQTGGVMEPQAEGWEGGELTYPCVFMAAGRRWMFYNGAGFGEGGFGLALWEG